MSYDVWLVVDTGAPEPTQVVDVGNYTSNVSPMWRRALGRRLHEYDGAPCTEAAGPLARAVTRMEADPGPYRAMEPANGWGSYEGALDYLRQVAQACAEHPRCTLRVHS